MFQRFYNVDSVGLWGTSEPLQSVVNHFEYVMVFFVHVSENLFGFQEIVLGSSIVMIHREGA